MLRPRPSDIPSGPATFVLVGERRDDPDVLLLLGDDGQYYGLHLPAGAVLPVEPDGPEWAIDSARASVEGLLG